LGEAAISLVFKFINDEQPEEDADHIDLVYCLSLMCADCPNQHR